MTPRDRINEKLLQSSSFYIEGKTQDSIKSKQSIRLSVITQFFPPDYAATGQLIEELVKNLGQQGVEVEVFTSQPGYAFKDASAPAIEQFERIFIQRSRSAQLWLGRIRGKAISGVLFTLRAILHLFKTSQRCNVLLLTTGSSIFDYSGIHSRNFLPTALYLYTLRPVPRYCDFLGSDI